MSAGKTTTKGAAHKSAKNATATGKTSKGWTDEEKAAMMTRRHAKL